MRMSTPRLVPIHVVPGKHWSDSAHQLERGTGTYNQCPLINRKKYGCEETTGSLAALACGLQGIGCGAVTLKLSSVIKTFDPSNEVLKTST